MAPQNFGMSSSGYAFMVEPMRVLPLPMKAVKGAAVARMGSVKGHQTVRSQHMRLVIRKLDQTQQQTADSGVALETICVAITAHRSGSRVTSARRAVRCQTDDVQEAPGTIRHVTGTARCVTHATVVIVCGVGAGKKDQKRVLCGPVRALRRFRRKTWWKCHVLLQTFQK